MINPWIEIPVEDYESHMSLPEIAQAQYLSKFFEENLLKYKPQEVAVIGSAGGNGLEKINAEVTNRIVCVDINKNFLELTRSRFGNMPAKLELILADITSSGFSSLPVDLIYCALILEYVDLEKSIRNISCLAKDKGKLVCVLQQPNNSLPEVTPSPYTTLNKLSSVFSFVNIDKLIKVSRQNGFNLISKEETTLASGKSFIEIIFEKI
jgi:ubiquinone/menaquinone biosynthesis C-methylase UbiE